MKGGKGGKDQYHSAVVTVSGVMEDDIALSAEEWMNMEFGAGGWVRDSWCDRFIALDHDYQGPGTAYVVFDRQRRRSTTVVYKHQVH